MTTFGETFCKTCVEMMLGHAEKMMFDKYFVGGWPMTCQKSWMLMSKILFQAVKEDL